MTHNRHLSSIQFCSTGTSNTRRLLCYITSAVFIIALATVACGTDVHGHPKFVDQSLQRQQLRPLTTAADSSPDKPLVRVRRQSFSMIQDLDALAEMLREASQRRRMQSALAFFNALRKRGSARTETATNGSGSQLILDAFSNDDVSALTTGAGEPNVLAASAVGREDIGEING